MNTDLDSMLDDKNAAPAEATPAPSAPDPVAAEPGVNEEAVPPAASTEQHADPEYVPRKAVMDERRKRQELERKLADLESQRSPKKQEPQADPPDWYADPEQAAQRMQFEMNNRLYQAAVYQSEKVMKSQHDDYDAVAAVFAEVATADPNLARQLFEHPFPAEFAYQTGKRIQLLREIGDDPLAYRAKLKAEIMAENGIASSSQPAPQTPARTSSVPRSLARDVSQQPRRTNGQFDAPASLDDILG